MSTESLDLLESLAVAGMRGGVPKIVEPCEIVREIEARDLPIILQELREHNWQKNNAAGADTVRVLRVGHHQLAQLLATGTSAVDASYVTGKSVATIASLQRDPAFRELMTYYERQQEPRNLNVYDRLVTVGALASEILQERLEESPEKFTNSELRGLLEIAAPAKGLSGRDDGPRTTLNVSINFVKGREGEAGVPQITEVKQIEEKVSDG